jgi:endoglycosylceramidase
VISDCQKNNFALYYSSPESVSAFDRLYSNIDGLQDKFIAYWDTVSSHFAKNKYVVGYDPINEPFVANYFTEPSLVLVPGKFDEDKLQPLHKRAFDTY